MKKCGFATSAILYTMLLLFMVLLIGILSNLQNKKTILDALKKDTIQALEGNTITDAILDQIAVINNKIVELETKFNNYQNNHAFIKEQYTLGDVNTAGTKVDTYYAAIGLAKNDIMTIYSFNGAFRVAPTAWTSYHIGQIENWDHGALSITAYGQCTGLPIIFTIDTDGNVSYAVRFQPSGEINEWVFGQIIVPA